MKNNQNNELVDFDIILDEIRDICILNDLYILLIIYLDITYINKE